MGRKTTPTAIKELHGNPGKRPLNKREPKPRIIGALSPPSVMSDDAKREWRRISAELYRLGLLTTIDRASLAAYCQAYGRWFHAERLLRQFEAKDPVAGLLAKTTNGNVIQSPLVGVANKAMADMVRYAAEFGMTPSARTRIATEGREIDAAEPTSSVAGFEQFLASNPDLVN